jgi:integrase
MAKPRKTESGKWRITIYDYMDSTGKKHQRTFTAETKREAERLANEYKTKPKVADLTVGEAILKYIDSKEPVISASTYTSYQSIYNTHFKSTRFGAVKLADLDSLTVQLFVSDLDLKAKTVSNIHGLLSASVKMFRPDAAFMTTLPPRTRPDLYTPTTAEVEQMLQEIKKDRNLYIMVLLCVFCPVRRSEACAVRYDDIDRKTNAITIRRACIRGEGKGNWIYKERPKTDASYRTVILPPEVVKAIGKGFGYIITGDTPAALSDRFTRVRNRAGLPHFRLHDLRHYSASILHAIGVPDQYIMQRGGWKTDYVMKRVYRNTMTDIEKKMNNKINRHFTKKMRLG